MTTYIDTDNGLMTAREIAAYCPKTMDECHARGLYPNCDMFGMCKHLPTEHKERLRENRKKQDEARTMRRELMEAATVFGNGDAQRGVALLKECADRLNHARGKHPWPQDADTLHHAALVVLDEAIELDDAAVNDGDKRAHDEALDVIATAVRFCNREWKI